MDGVGSAIRVDTRGREVMRILPRVNEAINEEWISDKTRHVVDGLRTQRLDRPYVREGGKLKPASWQQAFAAIKAKLDGTSAKKIGAIAGDLAAVEEMFALKQLLAKLGSTNVAAQNVAAFDPKAGRASYIFNPGIVGIEQADAVLIIGSDPRKEAAILNARIRKRWRASGMPIGVIGDQAELTYHYNYLGAGTDTLNDLIAHVKVVLVKDDAVAGVELEKIGFEFLDGPVTPKPESLPGKKRGGSARKAKVKDQVEKA
jgi:NADH-quinone oxidoreductase subunit G